MTARPPVTVQQLQAQPQTADGPVRLPAEAPTPPSHTEGGHPSTPALTRASTDTPAEQPPVAQHEGNDQHLATGPRLKPGPAATAVPPASSDHPDAAPAVPEQPKLRLGNRVVDVAAPPPAVPEPDVSEQPVSRQATPDTPPAEQLSAEHAPGADEPLSPDAPATESDLIQTIAPDRTASLASPTKSEGATPLPRPVLSAAWLQRLSEMLPRAVAGTWQTVRLALGDGDGELTVSARRDDDRIAVTIQFSDPRLRVLAADHAERLQGALEARYDTDVDLSFAESDSGSSHEQTPESDPHPRNSTGRSGPAEAAEQPAASKPMHPAARHEWIG